MIFLHAGHVGFVTCSRRAHKQVPAWYSIPTSASLQRLSAEVSLSEREDVLDCIWTSGTHLLESKPRKYQPTISTLIFFQFMYIRKQLSKVEKFFRSMKMGQQWWRNQLELKQARIHFRNPLKCFRGFIRILKKSSHSVKELLAVFYRWVNTFCGDFDQIRIRLDFQVGVLVINNVNVM